MIALHGKSLKYILFLSERIYVVIFMDFIFWRLENKISVKTKRVLFLFCFLNFILWQKCTLLSLNIYLK